MGAQEFFTSGTGEIVQEAFQEARERAFYDVGGTGTKGTVEPLLKKGIINSFLVK